MKSKVIYSKYSMWLTGIIFTLLFVFCIVTVHEEPAFFIILAVYILMGLSALCFGPAYVKATANYIELGSLFRSRKIPMAEVESVALFKPTMGAVRIFASGGFMGYWGIFREGDIGRYYGFYGKASDCFLVRLKNNKKYVLGCENPSAMIDYIKLHLRAS